MIVTSRSRTCSIRCQVSRRACGSRPVVISSRTATPGIADQGQRDRQPLLETTRQRPVEGVPFPGQASESMISARPTASRSAARSRALDGGGLSRPVRAQDAKDLTFADRERHVIDRNYGPVGLAQMRNRDSCVRRWGGGHVRPGLLGRGFAVARQQPHSDTSCSVFDRNGPTSVIRLSAGQPGAPSRAGPRLRKSACARKPTRLPQP